MTLLENLPLLFPYLCWKCHQLSAGLLSVQGDDDVSRHTLWPHVPSVCVVWNCGVYRDCSPFNLTYLCLDLVSPRHSPHPDITTGWLVEKTSSYLPRHGPARDSGDPPVLWTGLGVGHDDAWMSWLVTFPKVLRMWSVYCSQCSSWWATSVSHGAWHVAMSAHRRGVQLGRRWLRQVGAWRQWRQQDTQADREADGTGCDQGLLRGTVHSGSYQVRPALLVVSRMVGKGCDH